MPIRKATNAVSIISAHGHSETADRITTIGGIEVIVTEGLVEDLLSVNPLVDSGHMITLNRQGGVIVHTTTGKEVPIVRQGLGWKVLLSDIVDLTTDVPSDINPQTVTSVFSGRVMTVNTSQRVTIIELHERMGHPSKDVMCDAIRGRNPTWKLKLKVTPSDIRKVFKDYQCVHCVLAKRNLAGPGIEGNDTGATLPGELLAADPVGPIHPATKQGHIWYFIFKCLVTGYVHVCTAKSKDAFDSAFISVVDFYRSRGHKPRILRSDNDLVIDNEAMQTSLATYGMLHQHSAPYRQFQNGGIERDVQTFNKGVALQLPAQPWLQADQWDLAWHNFANCRNHVPNIHNKYKSPYHLVNGKPTNLDKTFQFEFGDVVAVRVSEPLRKWMEVRFEE